MARLRRLSPGGRRALALAALALLACKGDGAAPAGLLAAPTPADAALADARAIDAIVVDAPAIDAPTGPVTLGLCPAIEAVLAAQDSWFQALRGTDTGWKGLPRAKVQLDGADAVLTLRPDDRAGDWTARRAGAPGLVEGWIAEAAVCPPIADWYQVAASRTNHSWARSREIAQLDHGVTTDRALEVWISGGKREAWVTISVIDQEVEPGD